MSLYLHSHLSLPEPLEDRLWSSNNTNGKFELLKLSDLLEITQ